MLRKTLLALAATTAIAAAALAPTSASAKGGLFFGGFHGHHGFGGLGIAVVNPVRSCLQYRLVQTRWGGYRRVLVDVCGY
jgi:hypothetical protein